VLFIQFGPEVVIRGSFTLTVVFVKRDPWEAEAPEGWVVDGPRVAEGDGGGEGGTTEVEGREDDGGG